MRLFLYLTLMRFCTTKCTYIFKNELFIVGIIILSTFWYIRDLRNVIPRYEKSVGKEVSRENIQHPRNIIWFFETSKDHVFWSFTSSKLNCRYWSFPILPSLNFPNQFYNFFVCLENMLFLPSFWFYRILIMV